MDRVHRHLVIDPLEQRQLLSVTPHVVPSSPFDQLVNETFSDYNLSQETYAAQSIAVDDDGDFVVVWSRNDPVTNANGDLVDKYGNVLDSPHDVPITDQNIYARYFTDEVQRITLPDAAAFDNGVVDHWGNFSITIGGNETQKLTISEAAMPYTYKDGSNIQADFELAFDANGNGTLDSGEEVTISFDEMDMEGNAALMQSQLQGMGGYVYDIVVTAISPQEYIFQFGDQSGGLNQPLIQFNPAYTNYDSNTLQYLPGTVFETLNEPITISNITIMPDDPEMTAEIMEIMFEQTTEYYLDEYVSSRDQAKRDYNDYVDWGIEVRPVSGSTTQFDVTFTGVVSKTNVPLMRFAAITDDLGNNLLGLPEANVVTIKEPSPEFQVNNPDPQSAATPYLDYTDQTAPAVAIDADGDFVITWQSEVAGSGSSINTMDIYARRFTPVAWSEDESFIITTPAVPQLGILEKTQAVQSVIPLGDQFSVNTIETDVQDQPAIGMDINGNFVIAWVNTAQDLSYFNNISAQRYNRDGERIGGEFIVMDAADAIDTNVHFDPYVSLSNDGHILFTWTETDHINYILGGGITVNGWAKLFSPDMDIISTWGFGDAAADTSSAFDSGNNFLISGGTNSDPNEVFPSEGEDQGVYAAQYAINSGDTGITVLQDWFRVNSSNDVPTSLGDMPDWPGHQDNSQVMVDADGDIIITYEGYAPDTTYDLKLYANDFVDLINAEQNADLLPFLGTGMAVVLERGGYVADTGTHMHPGTGDLEAEIEAFLAKAYQAGATWEQLGRLRSAINEKVALYRGDPNGVMYTRLPAAYNSAQNVIESDVIINANRDGVNNRWVLAIPLDAASGSAEFQVWRESYESYYRSDSKHSYPPYPTTVSFKPVFYENKTLDVGKSIKALEDALLAADPALFGHARDDTKKSDGPIAVRCLNDIGYAISEFYDKQGTPWEYAYGDDYFIFEITFQGSAHDTSFVCQFTPKGNDFQNEAGDDIFAILYEYMDSETGTVQTEPSSGMTPDGSFVVAWTQYEEYSNGVFSSSNIYFREYKSSFDTAGPRVTEFLLPDGERLQDGDQIKTSLQNIVVTFDEELAISGDGSVLDPDNWALMKYDDNGDLVEVRGGITQIDFGMNKAADLSGLLGLNPIGTNKWEAVLTLDANGTEPGTVPLENGTYTIVAKNELRDPSANPLGHTGYTVNGFDMLTSFTISIPTGSETTVNSELDGVQETLPATSDDITQGTYPNSPQAIAGDANGECVVVWTDDGSGAGTTAGVYAKIYPMTWSEDADGERQSHQGLPREICVTDDLAASNLVTYTYASVARDGDGDFVVTWSAKDVDGDWNVWYRTFDAVGNPTSDSEIVNSEKEEFQQFSTVAMDNDGDFVITWQSQAQDGSGYGIFAQRFTPDGTNEHQTVELIDFNSNVTTFTLKCNCNGSVEETNQIVYNPSTSGSSIDPLEALTQTVQNELGLLGFETEVYVVSGTTLGVYFKGDSGCQDIATLSVDIKSFYKLPPSMEIESSVVVQAIQFTHTNVYTFDFTLNGTPYTTSPIFYDSTDPGSLATVASEIQTQLDGEGADATVTSIDGTTIEISFDSAGDSLDATHPSLNIQTTVPSGIVQTLDITDTGKNEFTFTLDFMIGATAHETGPIIYTSTDTNALASAAADIQAELDLLEIDATVSTVGDTTIQISYASTGTSLVSTNVSNVVGPDPDSEVETLTNGKTLYGRLGGLDEVHTIELKGDDIDVAIFSLNFDYGDTDITCGEVAYRAHVGDDPLQALIDDLQAEIDLLDKVDAEVFKFNETTLAIRYIGVSGCTDRPPILLDSITLVGGADKDLVLSTLRDGETSEFLVSETTQGDQMWPSIAMDYAGEFVITWTSFGQDGDTAYESNIYARKFADNEVVIKEINQQNLTDLGAGTTDTSDISSGMPLGSEFLVNIAYFLPSQDPNAPLDDNQKWSSVAMDADGDFVITWTGYDQDGAGNGYGPSYDGVNGIFARRFDKDAGEDNVPGAITNYQVFQVNTFVEDNQQHSSISMDTDGDFIIAWESFQEKPAVGTGPDAPDTYGIYAQRYISNDKLGTNDAYGVNGEFGGEFHVNTYEPGDQRFPAVAMDDTGDAVIVWNGANTLDTDGGVFLQRFEKPQDDTGPRVTEVEFVASHEGGLITVERITNGSYTNKDIIQLVVTFGEDLNIDYLEYGDNSILNLENWELCRLMSSGATSPIEGAITDVSFGRNEAFELDLVDTATGKYQAVVTIDYDPDESGVQPLPQGEYVLKIMQEVQDLFGNAIQPNMQNLASDYEFKFAVKESDLADTPMIPEGSATNLTDGRTYPESPSAVTVDGDGDYVAVWTAFDVALGVDRVFMMRFSAAGTPLWSDPQPLTPTGFGTDSQRYATVASDPDGDFIVTWTNYRDEDGAASNGQEQIDIYARRFAANGDAQGEAFRVNTYTAGDQIWSDVAMDANGGFVVTWSSLGQENNGMPGYGYGVYARLYDPYGYALGSEFQVNTTTGGNQQFASIDMAADGTFVIVWQSDQNGVGYDIVARTFNPDGSAKVSPLGGEYVVNDVRIGDQTYPDVAINLAGETFVVTWTSTQATTDPNGSAVYTKAFDIISSTETDLHYEYTGEPVEIPHGGNNPTEVRFFVGEGFLIEDLDITLNIQHDDPSDLWAWLEGPDGTKVLLFSNVPFEGDLAGTTTGGNGADFIDTTFDDEVETEITDSSVLPPFTGTYAPMQNLSAFNNTNAYGWWILKVQDKDPSSDKDKYIYTDNIRYEVEDGGYVMDWSIDLVRQPDISLETLVNTTTAGNQVYSSVDMDYQGNFIVTWSGYGDQEDQEDMSDYGVFTQQFAIPAQKVGSELRVNQMTIGRQWLSSVGMDAQGSFVTIWSGIGSTSDTSSNVFVRKQNAGSGGDDDDKAIDVSGPVVGGIYDGSDKVFEGQVLASTVDRLVVTFNEALNNDLTSSGSMEIAPINSVLNCDNWIIRLNGSEIIDGVTDVDYGFNPNTGKYEATIYFDGNGLTPGTDGLVAGAYELIIRDNIEDLEGNQLDGDYDGATGTQSSGTYGVNGYHFNFNVSDSTDRFGPEVRANDNTELVQLFSETYGTGQARETSVRSTAMDGNGDYVVVWTSVGQDDQNDPDGKGVYFQLYNSDGTERGVPVRVNNIITGNQQNASVAMDGAGDFVIVWESEQADGTYDVYSQRFNANGSRVANERVDRIDEDPLRGTTGFNALDAIENLTARGLTAEDIEVMVNSNQNYDQFNPEVAMDSYGNFIVVWGSAGTAYGYGNSVNAQIFDYDGEPIAEELHVSSNEGPGLASPGSAAGFKTNPTVSLDDYGRIMVAWDRIKNHASQVTVDTEIAGRLLNLNGSFLSSIFDPTLPRLTASAIGEGAIGTANDSVTIKVASTINPTMHEDSVIWWQSDLSRTARNPQVAMDSEGNFVIAYEAYRDPDSVDDDDLFSYGVFYSVYRASISTSVNGNSFKTAYEFTQRYSGQANTFMAYAIPDNDLGNWSDASIAAMSFIGDQVNPSVAINANGDFAITWNGPGAEPDPLNPTDPELISNQDKDGVWIRWFNLSGQSTSTQKRVNITEAGKQHFGSIAMNRDGDAVVAWAGAGVGDRHGVFSRQYDVMVDVVGPMATELYHKGQNPNVSAGDSYLFIGDGDQVYGNATSLLVVFNEEMDTSEKADNTPGTHSVENVNNWTLINGRNEEVSGAIDHIDFYFEATLNKWVAEIFFVDPAGLENGTYALIAQTEIYDAAGNILGKTGYRPNGTGMNLGYVDPFTHEAYGLVGDETILPLTNPTGGFSFQFGVNNTLPGDAAWGGIDQQVNEVEYGREDEAVIARNSLGNYVVAWVEYIPTAYYEYQTDQGDGTVHYDRYFIYQARIVAQRFDFWGREVGEEIEVNVFSLEASKLDTPIDLAIDDAGNFVVVWSANNVLIDGEDGIFVQRFDYDGDKMGGQIRVNDYREDIQKDPSVAMVGATGDFVVSWTSYGQDGNQDGIIARRYNLAGTPQGNEFIVNSHTFGAQRDSDVAADASGNFVVTWMGEAYSGGAGWEIFARRFNAAGTPLGNEFLVNTFTANNQETPAVAMDTQGNFVVTWASYVQNGNNLWDIYARRFNSAGVGQGNNFLVNQTTNFSQITPDVAMSTEKGFVVTWSSFNQDYPYDDDIRDYGIYARMFNPDGSDYVDARIGPNPVGEFRVNAVVLGDQVSPVVSMDAGGHYVVAWTGPNRPGTVGNFSGTSTTVPSGLPFVVTPDAYLQSDSTSIYSRLIDPPIEVSMATALQDVTIMGTSGDDVIEFIGGPTTNSWIIRINGIVSTVSNNVATLTLDGQGGNDLLLFTGSSEDDVISLAPGSSSFVSNDYTVLTQNIESVTANGGTGNNMVTIQDTSGDDVLTIEPGLAELVGPNSTLRAENFSTIFAISTSGADTVKIYDSAGDDTFTSTPTEASMAADEGGYNANAKGFRYVKGYSTGGTDTANLYDSAGDDLLVTHPAYAKLSGSGFYSIASDFRYIRAFATEGNDNARMYDSAGDDNFEANADYAKFSTSTYYVRADNFDTVKADGSAGGYNRATFWGTNGDDTFMAGNNYGQLVSDTYDIQANFFQKIIGRGKGGNDTATLVDSSGDDVLTMTSSFSRLEGPNCHVEAHSFEDIKTLAVNGGNDTATLYDSTGQDLLEAEEGLVRMSSLEMEYTYELLSFDQVTATSTTQGDKKDIDDDISFFLFAQGLWEDMD